MATSYQLFKYDSCPFCYRVRQFMDQAGIELELRDIQTEQAAFRELLQGGGRTTVPCLRIDTGDDVQWLFESLDIIEFMKQNLISEEK